MLGYIVNTDGAWFKFLTERHITNPVFWFKRDDNPNSRSIIKGNYIFLRITRTHPPVIKAFGTVAGLGALTLHKAFDKYGTRCGYESIDSMIEHSSGWRSGVELNSNTKIFCVEIENLRLTRDIRVDKELEPIGIVFDHLHIISGKGLTAEQTSALLQIAHVTIPAATVSEETEIKKSADIYGTENMPDEEIASDSARYLESHLQWFIFNNLQSLGIPGVKLYDPSIQQDTQGKYRTEEVGEIDLLLKSSSNDLYVVEMKKAGTDKTVGQICRYMGWAKHRLARQGQKVHGIIVTQDYDHRLSYAATVVNNLAVRRIQVAFTITSEEPELPE